MKRSSVLVSAAALLVATAIAALISGCDTASSTEDLTIEPSSAALSEGQSQEFTVSGGYDYTWSLATEGLGYLSARKGNRTVYTAPNPAPTNTSQQVHVESTIEGTGGGTSNSTSYSVSGDAYITFK